MGDTFRRTHVIEYSVASGELPSGTKLTNAFKQASDANRLIEKALGDIWNSGGSEFSNLKYINYITNLARSLGSMAILSPRTVETEVTYSDDLSAFEGQTDFYLKYAPKNGTLSSNGGDGALSTAKTSLDEVQAEGDYYIDGAHVFTYSPLGSGTTVQYTAIIPGDTDSPYGDQESGKYDLRRLEYNVIPDPHTTGWGSSSVMLNVADGGDYWTITLPYIDSSVTSARDGEIVPDSGGFGASRYYKLPDVLGQLSTAAGGSFPASAKAIPDNFLYIWDTSTNTIVGGLTYAYGDDHTIYAYPKSYLNTGDNRYALIVVNASLAAAVDNLRSLLHSHKHRRTYDAGSNEFYADGAEIDHKDLVGLMTPDYDSSLNPYCPLNAPYLSSVITPRLPRSRWQDDDHGQYLHRGGSWTKTEADYSGTYNRDRYDNAMLGDLLFAASSEDTSSPYWLHLNADSRAIYFGNVNGPKLYYNATHDSFELENKEFRAAQGATVLNGLAITTSSITGYYIVQPQDFHSDTRADTWDFYDNGGAEFYTQLNPGSAVERYLFHSVILPHTAGLSKMEVLFSTGAGTSFELMLQRADRTYTSNAVPTWSTIASINVNAVGTTTWQNTTSFSPSQIDNDSYMYRLKLKGNSAASAGIAIYLVRITYTYTYLHGR